VVEATGDHFLERELASEQAAEPAGEEGKALAEGILKLLAARGLEAGDELRAEILACDDPQRLERWLVRAATVAAAGDVVAEE